MGLFDQENLIINKDTQSPEAQTQEQKGMVDEAHGADNSIEELEKLVEEMNLPKSDNQISEENMTKLEGLVEEMNLSTAADKQMHDFLDKESPMLAISILKTEIKKMILEFGTDSTEGIKDLDVESGRILNYVEQLAQKAKQSGPGAGINTDLTGTRISMMLNEIKTEIGPELDKRIEMFKPLAETKGPGTGINIDLQGVRASRCIDNLTKVKEYINQLEN